VEERPSSRCSPRAHGDLPILLLDDVSSELDPQRNEFLFEHLATLAGQCFITNHHPGTSCCAKHRADYRNRRQGRDSRINLNG